MIRNTALIGLLGLALGACQAGVVGTTSHAVDTNSDGVVDCQDVDRVHMCLHLDSAETDALCNRADVTGDGIVNDQDIHGMFEGVSARGCDCLAPVSHATCGADCDTTDWEVMFSHTENENEHENQNEAGCEGGDCPGEQTRFRKRCRCRMRGCVGEDCPNCPEDCGCPDDDDPPDEDPPDEPDAPEEDPDEDPPEEDVPIID